MNESTPQEMPGRAQARLLLAQRGLATEMKQACEAVEAAPRGQIPQLIQGVIGRAMEMQTLAVEIQKLGRQMLAAQLAEHLPAGPPDEQPPATPGNGAAK